jgi:hypothetical protein
MSEIEKDSSEIASEEGFTGTFTAFMEWLSDALAYGGIRVLGEVLNGHDRPVIKVETFTGGFSSDEHLLSRVKCSAYMASSWISSHSGGLTVYEFPLWLANGTDELVWLAPEDGVFERIYRARHIRIYDKTGGFIELGYENGAELSFEEPDRDINEADGVLTIRPLAPLPPL